MSMMDELEETDQHEELQATIRRLSARLLRAENRSAAISEAVYEAIHDGISAIKIPPVRPPAKDRRRKGKEIAVLLVSDVQLGKQTESYDSEVAAARVRQLGEKTVKITELQRTNHPVKEVAVLFLGDEIEGELIFPGQAHEIDSSLYAQVTIEGPQILVGLLTFLAEHFEVVRAVGVPGNHGFVGGRQRREMHPESNSDRMLYRISSMLTDSVPNIRWDITDSWYRVVDLGDQCRFLCQATG